MSEPIIIGVDHGYAAMKTAHFSFHTGLVAHEHEPYTLSNVLEYGGKYYVVGSGRQPLQKNKTQTEDYYLLTLAAIAKELAYRNAGTAADIHLAAGLPLTSFGRDKKAFRDYLCRGGKPVSFRYEGQDYVITISKVSLYPQGYAAVLTQGSLLDEPSVIVADTTIYQGALVALDASGYAIPGKKAESLTAVGRAEETVTNTGADGELVIRVARGVFVFDNTATAANKITAAHVLKPCYMEDDHTVTALATGASVAGTVIRVDDEGVAVECGGYIPAAAAAGVGG